MGRTTAALRLLLYTPDAERWPSEMASFPLPVLLNDFALRSFRDMADRDYVHARLAFRSKLIPQFLWSSLHCLEKYAKGILLLNRIDSHRIRHEVTGALARLARRGKFEIVLSEEARRFVERLEDGAEFRYLEVSYSNREHDIVRLDRTVWELRRYCQPLDLDHMVDGALMNRLEANVACVRAAQARNSKNTCIINGWLEKIMKDRKHPAREPLLWNNLFFGPSRRKVVKMVPYWEATNAPLYLHPEILDEVVKYVFLPPRVESAWREELRNRRSNVSGRGDS